MMTEDIIQSDTQVSTDTKNLVKVFPLLLQLQENKGKYYGRSYCKHGHLSIFMNVERKWDRLANIMDSLIQNGTKDFFKSEGSHNETIVDTIADLATYSLLWLGYMYENHPDLIAKFISENHLKEEDCKALLRKCIG